MPRGWWLVPARYRPLDCFERIGEDMETFRWNGWQVSQVYERRILEMKNG